MKEPSKTIEEPIRQEEGDKPFNREEWEREHGPLFDDETMDSFLQAIYEAKHRKLPDYLRSKK
jgi:hypothetical protein